MLPPVSLHPCTNASWIHKSVHQCNEECFHLYLCIHAPMHPCTNASCIHKFVHPVAMHASTCISASMHLYILVPMQLWLHWSMHPCTEFHPSIDASMPSCTQASPSPVQLFMCQYIYDYVIHVSPPCTNAFIHNVHASVTCNIWNTMIGLDPC